MRGPTQVPWFKLERTSISKGWPQKQRHLLRVSSSPTVRLLSEIIIWTPLCLFNTTPLSLCRRYPRLLNRTLTRSHLLPQMPNTPIFEPILTTSNKHTYPHPRHDNAPTYQQSLDISHSLLLALTALSRATKKPDLHNHRNLSMAELKINGDRRFSHSLFLT